MSHVTTDFMVLVDIDFVPKLKLREYLVEIIKNMTLQVDSKVVVG